jgi:hypothetical protein
MADMRHDDEPMCEAFYADPVDDDGNVIGTAWMGPLKTPWGEITPTKVPHDEIVLDLENTIRAKLEDAS